MTSFAASAWPAQIAKLPDPFEMDVFPNPLGPTGKHASQVSSDGKGVSMASKNPDKAWIVLSRLYTGQRHGIERFANGLGSPGSRNDVWDSDEFNKIAPKLANIAKVMVLPPAPEYAALAPSCQWPLRRARADPDQRIHQGHPGSARRRQVRR